MRYEASKKRVEQAYENECAPDVASKCKTYAIVRIARLDVSADAGASLASTNWRAYCTRSVASIVSDSTTAFLVRWRCVAVRIGARAWPNRFIAHATKRFTHPRLLHNERHTQRAAPPGWPRFGPLATHGRFPYRPIIDTDAFRWPGGSGLAVYLGFNIEHFAFGEGLGAALGPVSPQPDVLNYSWREYGNRVGAWRCIELFDRPRPALGHADQHRALRPLPAN